MVYLYKDPKGETIMSVADVKPNLGRPTKSGSTDNDDVTALKQRLAELEKKLTEVLKTHKKSYMYLNVLMLPVLLMLCLSIAMSLIKVDTKMEHKNGKQLVASKNE